ncbi:hypothetical protein CJ030_MR8G005805 [Morella rubra]|uniref:Transposase MuDR plant domain-containing protein n=1 Tax=Morella rubra TaxID=262757 RepID=A0A6A1URB0_9ROSI|nr:hypothetical protein CJ030_MR8G005805 [Morella rubra]
MPNLRSSSALSQSVSCSHRLESLFVGTGGQGVAGGGLEPDGDGEESSESESDGDALVEENLSDVELIDGEGPELWLGVEGENEEELTRANVMSWFGTGPNITREEEEIPVDIGSSDDVTYVEEDRGAGRDEDTGLGRDEDVCIQNGFEYTYGRNDKKKVTAKCKALQCHWRIHVSKMNVSGSMTIKTYRSTHNCDTHYKNKSVNPAWIARNYLELVRDTLNLSPGGLLDALDIIVPFNEHRYCLKHLHSNIKGKGYKGQSFKDVLFACAKSNTKASFKMHMEEMRALSPV